MHKRSCHGCNRPSTKDPKKTTEKEGIYEEKGEC